MVDLASERGRVVTQSRVTNNRDTVLPGRRLDQRDDLAVRADMRNAYRTDAQVDELRRTLGMVEDATQALVVYDQKKHFEAEKKQAGQARLDDAAGQVNEAAMAKSEAYRITIARSRARKRAAEAGVGLEDAVNALLAKGATADPTKGEMPVDLDDVNALLDERFKPLLFDEQGRPIDYGDPQANVTLYDELNKLREQVNKDAATAIQAQKQSLALSGLGDELELDIAKVDAKTGFVDVETYVRRAAVLGIPLARAKQWFLQAAVNGATVHEKPEILRRLADSRRSDGTPTWSPAEEGQLRDAAHREGENLREKTEREAEKKSADTRGKLSVEIRQGARLTPQRVEQLIATGDLRPQDAELAFAVQNRFDDERREEVVRARQDRQWAWALQENAFQIEQRKHARQQWRMEDTIYSGTAGQISIDIAKGAVSPTAARTRIDTAYATGLINNKVAKSLYDATNNMPTDAQLVMSQGAAIWEGELAGILGGAVRNVEPKAVGIMTARANASKIVFYQRLRAGDDGRTAFAKALQAIPGVKEDGIRGSLAKGDRAAAGATAKESKTGS